MGFRYYIVFEDLDVVGTDDSLVAAALSSEIDDGAVRAVIDTKENKELYNGIHVPTEIVDAHGSTNEF